ncbi:uncharacterized protein METZ01_LOCUS445077, partial [marine metagenome]
VNGTVQDSRRKYLCACNATAVDTLRVISRQKDQLLKRRNLA